MRFVRRLLNRFYWGNNKPFREYNIIRHMKEEPFYSDEHGQQLYDERLGIGALSEGDLERIAGVKNE